MKAKLKNKFKLYFSSFKIKVKILKRDVGALYLASRRPDVPFYAKLTALLIVAYALSPIDLIPDFIPVLGYIDDLILVPLGIILAVKLIPKDIMTECRKQAEDIFKEGKPQNWIVGCVIICIWIIILFLLIKYLYLHNYL